MINNANEKNMEVIDKLLAEYIRDFQNKKNLPFVVKNSIPIVWFGDINKYYESEKKILTIGLNPSEQEFMFENLNGFMVELPNLQKRFKVLDFEKQNEENLIELKNNLNNYFNNNPYKTWFIKYNKLIEVLNCSYGCKSWDKGKDYKNTAIHIDIYSAIATTPTWGKLSGVQKEQVKNLHLFSNLFGVLDPDIILSSVNKEVFSEMFSDWELIAEYEFGKGNYIKAYKRYNKILINGRNFNGTPFGGIKETKTKETIVDILNNNK